MQERLIKINKDNKIYAILGDIARKHSSINIQLLNYVLNTLNMESISSKSLNNYLDVLKNKGSEYELYSKIKSGNLNLSEYLDSEDDTPTCLSFLDESGLETQISLSNLDRMIYLKQEYEKGYAGTIPWTKLKKKCSSLGFQIANTESFRELMVVRENKINTIPKAVQNTKQYHKDLNDVFETEIGKLNIKNRSAQNNTRLFNRLKRNLTDEHIFRQQLLESIPKFINIGSLPKVKNNKGGQTLLVSVSDIHVGLKTKDYNYKVLKLRMSYYVNQVKRYVANNKVSHIIVAGLGDLIEGAYMHNTQLYELEFGMGEQVSKALTLLLSFVIAIRKLGVKTSYVAVSGNHDRENGANKKDNLFGDSIVDIINAIIEEKSKDLNINYITPDTKVRHLLSINGTNIALVHGDLDRLQDKALISKLSSFFNKKVDSVVAGHLHSFYLSTLGYNQYLIQTSSAFDGNSYSDKLGVKNTPGQLMVSIDTKGRINPIFIPF